MTALEKLEAAERLIRGRADAMHPGVAHALAELFKAAATAWPIDHSEPPRNPRDRRMAYEVVALADAFIAANGPATEPKPCGETVGITNPRVCVLPKDHGGDWHDDGKACWPVDVIYAPSISGPMSGLVTPPRCYSCRLELGECECWRNNRTEER